MEHVACLWSHRWLRGLITAGVGPGRAMTGVVGEKNKMGGWKRREMRGRGGAGEREKSVNMKWSDGYCKGGRIEHEHERCTHLL